ncbi:MAG: VWA domain-containing protein [Acidobacteriota bacterium]
MRSKFLSLTILCFVLAFGLPATAQKPPEKQGADKKAEQDPAIKVSTTLVEVRAVVTDRQDRLVKDLKKEDFEILENKQLQEVSFFSQITVGERVPSTPELAGNTGAAAERRRPGAASDSPTRTIVLFVDNLHMSDTSLLFAKQTLKRFIAEKLAEDDLVAVMTSGGTLGLFSQFTRDKRVLQYAVDKIGARSTNAHTNFTPYLASQVELGAPDALDFAIQVMAVEDAITGPRNMMESLARARSSQIMSEATYQRRIALLTITALTERLATLPGQRLIVALSDGFTLYGQGGSIDTSDLQRVTSKAAVAGVVIYTIDARGLAPPPGFDVSLRGMNGAPAANGFLSRAESDNENVLNALARDTGGEPYRNTNDLVGSMRKALDNNSSFYALSYYPGDDESSKFRRITVRVKGHPEYKVRAQQGYLPSALAKASKDAAVKTPQQRLAEAAVAPLAIADIGVFATADFIETEVDNAQVSLQVFIDGAKLQYTEEKERHRFALEMIALVFDASGKQIKADSTAIQTNLLPASMERAKALGLRYSRRIELKPGTYQIRVGIRELETDKMGTAAAWVEIPELGGKKLQVSNILLTDPTTLDYVSTLGKENLSLQNGTRQGLKAYRQRDILGFYVRVYPPAKATADELTGLTYQTEIWLGDRIVAETGWKPLQSSPDTLKGVELGRQIPLSGIAPGFYDLKVVVKSPKTKNPTVRSAAFEITR